MNDEFSEPLQMELFAASLRADATDVKAFLEALAAKLQGALPQQTTVTRHSGLFAREHPVKSVELTLGDYHYSISRERQGPLLARRAKIVRGIVLKNDQLTVEQWIEELATALAATAASSAQARDALHRFLI